LAAQVAEQVTGQMAEAEVLKDEITKALGGALGKLAEGLIVEPAEGGLLVSITDQLDFGMFNVGSAVPGRDLVLAMEKIGEVLAERNGAIAIRGHTDARPFASGTDDNWRLSLARAHSAYYMLVRGGVPEERINQVSGFADRRLKDPDDPYSEVNRRIEILVEAEGT
jgi:chemotaxis protein MotB